MRDVEINDPFGSFISQFFNVLKSQFAPVLVVNLKQIICFEQWNINYVMYKLRILVIVLTQQLNKLMNSLQNKNRKKIKHVLNLMQNIAISIDAIESRLFLSKD
ncbi:Hypothetical_protein [Hexamita inflata]|uniref:Hypothetical_protein n=1 Tax=Hexamita inflata TaxID=28002 RepID=A0AA86TMD2_9EUKA|nr:Hypothetical protein HINF_LOCUS7697 [Hexamita inflata]